MLSSFANVALPDYQDAPWGPRGLPTRGECWELSGSHATTPEAPPETTHEGWFSDWDWPARSLFFIADAHADAEAFVASLVASGGVRQTAPRPTALELTDEGRRGLFVIGGDCLDKGPSNLELLRAIRALVATGAEVKLLAGNHDMRLLMGLRSLVLERTPLTEHWFVRMGPKVVPLLREVFQTYLAAGPIPDTVPDEAECRRRLLPSADWFARFPLEASRLMSPTAIDREIKRLQEKVDSFESACEVAGLTIREVYATALKCIELFCEPAGEFYWFFDEMELAHQEGAFLFIHAGLDDTVAGLLATEGVSHLNQLYRHHSQHELFDFYYGPLANTVRTKYRKVDRTLSDAGVQQARSVGVRAVVHGHRNRLSGQQLTLRQGLLHVEGDVTLDRNSRRKEGLPGVGAGVTIIRPQGQLIGISTDYPYAKVFMPDPNNHPSC